MAEMNSPHLKNLTDSVYSKFYLGLKYACESSVRRLPEVPRISDAALWHSLAAVEHVMPSP